MVCVRERDGGTRPCVDHRELNMEIQPDRMPIPRVQDIADNLRGQNYFTSLWGLCEWLRIPFELLNAPLAFQLFMNECLATLRDSNYIPYLSDILCYGKMFDKHLENLRRVLWRLKNFVAKLKAEKCVFFKKERK